MGRPGFGSRLAGALIAAAAILAVGPASAAALTKPERKAVDIASIDASTTSDTAYAEIGFKGDIRRGLGTGGLRNARVTIELVPESGPTTVITDRKSSRRPKEGRTGTTGRFDLVRNGRAIVLLVAGLPAPAAQVVVRTSDPTGARARTARRGFEPSDYDVEVGDTEAIVTEDQLENSITVANDTVGANESRLRNLDTQAEKTIDDLARAEREWRQAKGSGAARDARERVEKLETKLEELTEERKALRAENKLLERWIKVLQDIQSGATKRQCNDGVDNGDPEDEIADHAGGDPGCVSPVDNDEKDVEIPVSCPNPGASTSPFAVINAPMSNGFTSLLVTRAQDGFAVLDSQVSGTSAGPAPFPADICGAGFNETFQWVIFQDGDPLGLPDPPPGDHGICLFIEIENQAGSEMPGGQSVPLRFAVGTAPVP